MKLLKVTARKGEPVESMLRRFRRKCERAGVIKEFRRHQFFEKPSDRARRDERKAVSRQRRTEAGKT